MEFIELSQTKTYHPDLNEFNKMINDLDISESNNKNIKIYKKYIEETENVLSTYLCKEYSLSQIESNKIFKEVNNLLNVNYDNLYKPNQKIYNIIKEIYKKVDKNYSFITYITDINNLSHKHEIYLCHLNKRIKKHYLNKK